MPSTCIRSRGWKERSGSVSLNLSVTGLEPLSTIQAANCQIQCRFNVSSYLDRGGRLHLCVSVRYTSCCCCFKTLTLLFKPLFKIYTFHFADDGNVRASLVNIFWQQVTQKIATLSRVSSFRCKKKLMQTSREVFTFVCSRLIAAIRCIFFLSFLCAQAYWWHHNSGRNRKKERWQQTDYNPVITG